MNKKVALVTGSSSGIGASIVEEFAKNNYNVVINYSSNKDNALKLKEKLEKLYNIKAFCIKCDISKDEEVESMKNEVLNTFNRIDTVINNAGIAIDTLFEDKTKEMFMKTLEINLYGTFLVSKVFGKIMFDNKEGNIVNISSTNGIDTYYEFSIDYDASKAGVINLTHNLANHFAPYVRVNAVCPGWVNTPMNKELSQEFKDEEINKILLSRFAEPNEIAKIVYFLSTEDASYINDSIIRIDGGKKC